MSVSPTCKQFVKHMLQDVCKYYPIDIMFILLQLRGQRYEAASLSDNGGACM